MVAFYTSMTLRYAEPARNWLCEGLGRELPLLYAQEFNKRDPEGEFPWSMMRDLPRVMKDATMQVAQGTSLIRTVVAESAYAFDETNTVMVDDTPRKMREYPHNVIIVPEYVDDSVQGGDHAASGDVHVLDTVQACLQRLLHQWREAHTDDVRVFVDRAQQELAAVSASPS
jgi:hypothetical protein